jgi:hypothetical protein
MVTSAKGLKPEKDYAGEGQQSRRAVESTKTKIEHALSEL